jgi:hypothetical protein
MAEFRTKAVAAEVELPLKGRTARIQRKELASKGRSSRTLFPQRRAILFSWAARFYYLKLQIRGKS